MSEIRKVVYDEQLKIEAYQFQGIMQKFPNHFHEHYVIGFIEKGKRHLSCRNKELEELRQQCGMNKYVMLRNFAMQKGITPYQYLIATRINEAMKLLEKDYDPLDVALKTGFTDQSHFSNAFKRTIGLTPGQYKMIRSKKK